MKSRHRQNLIAAALAGMLVLGMVCTPRAYSQSEESEPAPALGKFEAEPLPPPERPFLVPDVPPSVLDQMQIKERWITLKVGLVALADYTAFNQDSASIGQVGPQEDQWEARAARLMARGTIGRDYKIGYLVAGEYKGFESEPETLWTLTDVAFIFPLGGPATKLTLGKTKETFAYEMVGDPAMETRARLGPHLAGPFRGDRRDGQCSDAVPMDLLTLTGETNEHQREKHPPRHCPRVRSASSHWIGIWG
jgi:phosphate-selective porin OprO/OprP